LRSWKKRLKPHDIRSKEFKKKTFGIGYDPEEVEAFLIEVANAYQELLEELEELEREFLKSDFDTQELMKETRKGIEEILQRKTRAEEEIERQKREIEIEIERLKLIRKKLFEKIKLVILDMAGIIEEIKPGVSVEKHQNKL